MLRWWDHYHSGIAMVPQTPSHYRFTSHYDLNTTGSVTEHNGMRGRGQNSSVDSVLRLLSCVMQHGRFSWVDFSLVVLNMDSDSIPYSNSFGWKYKTRSSLHMYAFHHMDSKRSWYSCPRRVNGSNKNTPTTHHPWRQTVTTPTFGLNI